VGFVLGIILSALTNNFADLIQDTFLIRERITAVQYTIWSLSAFSGLAMLLPVLMINERTFAIGRPSHIPLIPAIKNTFRNGNFKYYLISDFAYYTALSIISSGLLFFVTVLLGLPESDGGKFMGVMVLTSLLFYPLINWGAKKYGKKPFVLMAFAVLCLIFAAIYFLGKMPFAPDRAASSRPLAGESPASVRVSAPMRWPKARVRPARSPCQNGILPGTPVAGVTRTLSRVI
ncbi:MAG: hypothetical protein EOP21_10445, partial [Hyphomicrobiales bacterium]